jgi:hypothetical protein
MALPVTPTPLLRIALATGMTAAMAAGMSVAAVAAHGAAAAPTLTAAAQGDYVHPDVTVVIGGTKSADATLEVTHHAPGSRWTNISARCTGISTDATTWSCALPPSNGENRPGANVFEVEQTHSSGIRDSVRLKVVVVPFASQKGLVAAPEPKPEPAPEPEQTVVPPSPDPLPRETAPPAPLASPSPTPTPQAIERQESAPQAPEPIRATTPAPVSIEPEFTPSLVAEPQLAIQLPTQVFADEERISEAAQVAPERGRTAETPSALSGFPTFRDIVMNPIALAAASFMSLLYLLLVTVPAQILDSTLEANSHRWRKLTSWTARISERMSPAGAWLQNRGLAGPLLVIGTSIAFAFADPNFGFDPASLRLVASLAIGLLLVIHLPNLITAAIMGRRYRVSSSIISQPSAIMIAVVGVIASRLLEFSPGLLVGLVIGLQLAADAREEDQRRAIVVRFAATYAIAVAAWLAYSWLEEALAGTPPTVMSVFLSETLIATVIEGLTALVVAVLPLVFLDGRELWAKSKKLWATIAAPIVFTFALLVLPSLDALDEDAPLTVWIGIFVGFSIVTALVWAAFRVVELREARVDAPRDESEADVTHAGSVGRGR